MIEFRNATKAYPIRNGGRKVVLDNQTLTLPHRNIAILGANGSGKSTLLRLIAGTDKPDIGQIIRSGRISWPLGFGGSFNGSLTAAENLRFVARIYGCDIDEITAFAEDFAELGEFFHMPVATYSSGMRTRLAFALSMAVDFDTYLVDEIIEVGDAYFKEKCRLTFKNKLKHANMIVVTHSIQTLKTYCEIGAVLKNGRIEVFDDIDEAIAVHQGFVQN